MRIIAKFHKKGDLRFISHLDVQRLMQRALRRAGISMLYSQGFNPHPLMAFASALAVGYTSDAEWMDVRLEDGTILEDFPEKVNAMLPNGLLIEKAFEIDETLPALTALIHSVHYRVTLYTSGKDMDLQAGIETMLSGPILVMKRTKGGMKQVDIREQVLDMRLETQTTDEAVLRIHGVLNASGGLQVDLLLRAYADILTKEKICWGVHRTAVEFDRIEV